MKRLRSGLTTGLCATAAAKAATIMLLTNQPLDQVKVTAKDGSHHVLDLVAVTRQAGAVTCGVVKDAGDDPDVTHGAMILASVSQTEQPGISLDGGVGVGRVTKPGLKVPIGQAAINPVPRQMILEAVTRVCHEQAIEPAFAVVISIPDGERLADKTMNARLGIIGGLSVLGTTGIVEPMSQQAIIETIKAEIDVQLASGQTRLLITPGNYGRDFAEQVLGLDISQAIKCSNFIGETLDYLALSGVTDICLIGHAGKLVKLAAGIMQTHSKVADGRMEILAAHAGMAGGSPELIQNIMDCVTTEAAIELLISAGLNQAVWQTIGHKVSDHLGHRTKGQVRVEYIIFTQDHGVLVRGVSNDR